MSVKMISKMITCKKKKPPRAPPHRAIKMNKDPPAKLAK